MTSKAETKLYQAISSAIAHASNGHNPDGFTINIPFDELIPGDETGIMLKVAIDFDWTSFEDVYYEDMLDELEE